MVKTCKIRKVKYTYYINFPVYLINLQQIQKVIQESLWDYSGDLSVKMWWDVFKSYSFGVRMQIKTFKYITNRLCHYHLSN